jgi:hypothetical protein
LPIGGNWRRSCGRCAGSWRRWTSRTKGRFRLRAVPSGPIHRGAQAQCRANVPAAPPKLNRPESCSNLDVGESPPAPGPHGDFGSPVLGGERCPRHQAGLGLWQLCSTRARVWWVISDCSWGNKKPAAEAARGVVCGNKKVRLGSTLAHLFESTQTGTFRLTVCQAFYNILRFSSKSCARCCNRLLPCPVHPSLKASCRCWLRLLIQGNCGRD